jgi:dipeptidyl-peptidase-4
MKNSIVKSLLLLITLVSTMNVVAQEKKSFTLEDLMPGGNNYYNLLPQNIYGLQWWGDVCIKGDIDDVKAIDPANGKENVLITLQEVNDLLAAGKLGKIHHFRSISFPYAEKLMLVNTTTHKALIDLNKKEIVWNQPIAPKAANQDWNEESRSLAYTIDNNLFVTTADGKTVQVTNEPEGIVCGQSVHRNEFGISKGTFWSPKGNLLAFYRMDQSMVTDYPQVNTSTRIATLEPDKYPMAGMISHKVTVGVYNPSTQKTIYLKAGDPTDRYFTNISWSPDEKTIYVIELNRDQNHSKLVRYNAETGDRMEIFYEEEHPSYVEPQHTLTFLPWDNDKFIYQSQRDGFNHLYLFDIGVKFDSSETQKTATGSKYTQDAQVKQLTQGEWLVQGILGFNEKTKEVIIMSTEVSPLQSNAYAVNVNTGKRRLIGNKDGMHSVQLSGSGKYVIDNYTSFTIPRNIEIVPTSGKGKSINLLTATNPMEAYNMPEITVGTIKAADGKTDLYYRLIKPVNFDPNKKYPAVIYVYGGPHAQMIHNTRNYDARGWDIYMAQLGYVMLTVDNRGSDNRGLEFENCTFRQLGTEEMKDQVKGVDFLKSLGYVDDNRIGVHGWSFGGFMTTNLMLTYNDIFKVGVAGGPVIDWAYYEIMYGERYMDTPQSNPKGYKKANLKLRAGDLKGRLEIIIGANDPTCVPQHSITFLRACIDAGTQPDFFMYPGDGHNMFGRDRVHLYERITRYFEDHLK